MTGVSLRDYPAAAEIYLALNHLQNAFTVGGGISLLLVNADIYIMQKVFSLYCIQMMTGNTILVR